MFIGSNDTVESKRQTKCFERKVKTTEKKTQKEKKETEMKKEMEERTAEFENLTTPECNEEPQKKKRKNHEKDENFSDDNIESGDDLDERNMLKIPHTATASIRYKVSEAQTAAVVTGYLNDLIEGGILDEDQRYLTVDPMKVHRAKHKVMSVLQLKGKESLEEDKPSCIMFDGRIDKTKVRTRNIETKRDYETIEEEDHYSVTDDKGVYLTHITKLPPGPNQKPAQSLAMQIFEWLCDFGIDEVLKTVAGDSTNGNTGWKGGHFAWLEEYLEHKLHWLICQLHTNELPLRVLIKILIGMTTSKSGFTGIIGKLLPTVPDLDRNFDFDAIAGGLPMPELSNDVVSDLSTDQKYAYKIMKAIRTGDISLELSLLNPGKICHSRWLTTANTVCLLYCSKHNLDTDLSRKLTAVVTYIVLVYYPAWFQIKVHHSWIDGPANILHQFKLLKTQPEEIQTLLAENVRRSAWFAYSECILVTLLKGDEEDRAWAVNKILEIRGESLKGK